MSQDGIKSPLAVVVFQGVPVVYRRVDEWVEQAQPYQTGGTMRQHVRSGRKVIEAHELGRHQLLELTLELVAAIEADEARMRGKQ